MNKILVICGFALMTLNAQAGSPNGTLGCEIRTAKNASPAISVSVKINNIGLLTIIGKVGEKLITLGSAGSYAGKSILSLAIVSPTGDLQAESYGVAGNVIGLTSATSENYISILCREGIDE